MRPCLTSDFGAVLNEAQQQLDWGTEVGALTKVARCLQTLDPEHRLVRQLERKIVRLNVWGTISRQERQSSEFRDGPGTQNNPEDILEEGPQVSKEAPLTRSATKTQEHPRKG